MSKYEAVIGLEIHAELKTKTKMFCACKNDPFHSQANENICPVCMAMPGALPVLNQEAIKKTIKTGLALNCKVNEYTKWDRKNYFYPDLPKGYQISQFDYPLVYDGFMDVLGRKIGITRIHLEEDTGTSKHPEGREGIDYTMLDFNRAGVPLMELVTEPDIRSAEEAKVFCQNYQKILRSLEVASASMEKGEMRCEANISIRKTGEEKFGTKVEVKNLNSFKAVERAIIYELKRQEEALESGEKIVQETRGWDDKNQRTYVMRIKETSADYRYFPEPDLPTLTISKEEIESIKKELPELPEEKAKRFMSEFGLDIKQAHLISRDLELTRKFEEDVSKNKRLSSNIANMLINMPEAYRFIDSDQRISIIEKVCNNELSLIQIKELIKDIETEPHLTRAVADKINRLEKENKLVTSSLESIIDKVISHNPDAVAKIKSGNKGVVGFLVGQVMKEAKGKANPKIVNELLNKKL